MPTQMHWTLIALSLILLGGCSSAKRPPEPAAERVAPATAEIGSLSDLLARPRNELAKRSEELLDRIKFQERMIQERRRELALLPSYRLPLVVPVLRTTKFSATAGFSLPPYLAEGGRDGALALHLACYGDLEAARKLADPSDVARLEELKFARNYPVEWTRYVGLLLHDAQMQVAAGDREGMERLLSFNRQLRELLDATAAKGHLGAALLPRGKLVLAEAAAAWRKQKREDLANEAEQAVRNWASFPAVHHVFRFGMSTADVERVFGPAGQGHAVAAKQTERALDLLDLPVPSEHVGSVLAVFDSKRQLAELLLVYRDGMAEKFFTPQQLAYALEEIASGQAYATAGAISRRDYTTAQGAWQVMLIPHRVGTGAVVRLRVPNGGEPLPIPREFGLVNLDRSFEQNRVRFAPEQRGDTLHVKHAKALSQVAQPIDKAKPVAATLGREPGQDLTARLAVQFVVPENPVELQELALPLWNSLGSCTFEDVKQEGVSHLALVWRDSKTEYRLKIPYARASVEWEARDTRGGDQRAARVAAAAALDQQERLARLKAGHPQVRIPRLRERLELGMPREQALKLLPTGQTAHKREFSGGMLVTLNGEIARQAAAAARQMVLRFDGRGQLVELRVRYLDGPAAKGQDPLADLLRRCGASSEGPSPAAMLWADLSRGGRPPVQHYWQDDATTATCVREGNVTEVVLRDRPAEQQADLPPLDYLPRGPLGCVLGMSREDLLRQWNVTTPMTLADGALVLRPQNPRPHDALLVWFENNRVCRLVARHDMATSRGAAPQQLAQAVAEIWGRDLRNLGWPSWQDQTPQGALQSLGWHDGSTRVRTFWQEQDDGPPRLYTEYKDLHNP